MAVGAAVEEAAVARTSPLHGVSVGWRPEIAGVGIGWRPEIAGVIATLPELSFVEVIAESLGHYGSFAVDPEIAKLHNRGIDAIPHGIRLSLGSATGVETERIAHLASCAEALNSPLVSEHIAFVRAGGIEAGHLLPMPRTREALEVLTANIRKTQANLPVPLAVENVAALFEWPDAEFTESEFLAELVERTGVLLLLDVANLYANARNCGRDPFDELERMPVEHVAYCHVAGGAESDGMYHDTHTHPVPEAVLDLVTAFAEKRRDAGLGVPAFMLERDGDYPPEAELRAEYEAIRAATTQPLPTAAR